MIRRMLICLFVFLMTIEAIGLDQARPQSSAFAQGNCRTFTETNKTVCGRFLDYWMTHGDVPQQGFPISNEMQEKSDTDSKVHTVQYFERSVFESHSENVPPNDVLLSLLGVFSYNQLYPATSGAPGQVASAEPNATLVPETGKHMGGLFLDYWRKHGGLAQQGFPISEEFNEVSRLDGKSYKVQYFERAVFEYHPENQAPNNVLLSQLGAFRYKTKYASPPAASSPTPVLVQPTSTAIPTVVAGPDCSGIPPSQNLTSTPNCGPAGTTFKFVGSGFDPSESVGVYTTLPSGQVYGTPDTANVEADGTVKDWFVNTQTKDPLGIWAITMEGLASRHKAIGYFKVTPPVAVDCSGIPDNTTMTVTPKCAPAGTRFSLDAYGFTPGEIVTRYYKTPSGQGFSGSSNVLGVGPDGKLATATFVSASDDERGVWSATYEGQTSGHKAVGYFKVTAP